MYMEELLCQIKISLFKFLQRYKYFKDLGWPLVFEKFLSGFWYTRFPVFIYSKVNLKTELRIITKFKRYFKASLNVFIEKKTDNEKYFLYCDRFLV